ncbi:MAG: glycosyltransferase family 9 protein [Gemmatimonadetes bacterium]|nr:glycosyltransferase family 9 protein [Gemmatimonadota bacterium]
MNVPLDRVAVVMMSTVGNAVHTLPVITSLKAHRPDARITWIMQPGSAALVQGHAAVDDVVVVDRKRGMAGFAALRRAMAERRFDVALNLQAYLKAGVAAALTRAPVRVGYDRARARDLTWLFSTHRLPARPRGHVQDEFLEFLHFLGVPVRLEWGLEPTDEERTRYAQLLPEAPGPTLAMVVGTTKAEKEWPAERYAALADRVAVELGGRTVLVGGRSPREEAAAAAITSAASHPPLDLREWDLRRLAYLLARADVLVSPDTGPLHVGVALGTPTVALMGHTNPKRYGPYRRFGDLLVDAFGEPGEDYPIDAPNRPGRMGRITVDQVMEKVDLALRRYRSSSPDGQPSP